MLLMSLSSSSISILPRYSTLKLLSPVDVLHFVVPDSTWMLLLFETVIFWAKAVEKSKNNPKTLASTLFIDDVFIVRLRYTVLYDASIPFRYAHSKVIVMNCQSNVVGRKFQVN